MRLEGPGQALCVLVSQSDEWHGKPVYQEIVQRAHEFGLSGATVLQGLIGYGIHRHIHDVDIEVTAGDLPISILMVDSHEKIAAFAATLDELVMEGSVQTWDVNVEVYRHSEGKWVLGP